MSTSSHTAVPVSMLNIFISSGLIPGKETSIERCREYIETKPSAKEMFLKVLIVGDCTFRDFTRPAIASGTFVNVYAAIAIIIISW